MECVKWFHNGCGVFIGSGILVFDNEASVDEAARLPGPTVMGRQVEVESPLGGGSLDKDCELYLWGLPPSAVEEDVRMYYTDKGLTRLKFKMKPDYSSTVGVAFANFESAEAAMKALEMGPPEIRGVKCCVKPSGYQGEKEVCIRGSDKLTDAVLRKQYEAFGADGILSIQWQRRGHDPSSSCRAFVCFKTADMALQALTWGNFMLGDKVMEVFQTGKRFKVLDKEGPGSDAGTDGLPAPTALPDPPMPPMPGTAPAPSTGTTPPSRTAPDPPLPTTPPSPSEEGVHTSAPLQPVPPTLGSPHAHRDALPPSPPSTTSDWWRSGGRRSFTESVTQSLRRSVGGAQAPAPPEAQERCPVLIERFSQRRISRTPPSCTSPSSASHTSSPSDHSPMR